MSGCKQELCPNWSGDGDACPCALFDLDPDTRISVWFAEEEDEDA